MATANMATANGSLHEPPAEAAAVTATAAGADTTAAAAAASVISPTTIIDAHAFPLLAPIATLPHATLAHSLAADADAQTALTALTALTADGADGADGASSPDALVAKALAHSTWLREQLSRSLSSLRSAAPHNASALAAADDATDAHTADAHTTPPLAPPRAVQTRAPPAPPAAVAAAATGFGRLLDDIRQRRATLRPHTSHPPGSARDDAGGGAGRCGSAPSLCGSSSSVAAMLAKEAAFRVSSRDGVGGGGAQGRAGAAGVPEGRDGDARHAANGAAEEVVSDEEWELSI
jgi:hypothetical protein